MDHIAEVQKVKETEKGTYIQVLVPDSFLETRIERYKQGNKACLGIKLNDGRTIRAEQRKSYWATLKDISDSTGHLIEYLHDYFKMLYRCFHEDVKISMSNCTVTQARDIINIVMDFALENNVSLSDKAINRAGDIDRYLYKCIVLRLCVCCGKPNSDFHHFSKSRIGMGGNRKKVDHVGREGFTLCREHHSQIHQMGEKEFCEKHKVYPIELDEYAVKKLKL